VGIESSVGLIVASLDLQLVRMLRRAMQGAGGAAPSPLHLVHPPPTVEPRKRTGGEPVVEPRPRVRPEPAFDPRPTLHGRATASDCCAGCAPLATAAPAERATAPSSPVEPPWKVLPWERGHEPPPARPVRKIKVFVSRPDSFCKGSVLDLFI
jgi:hypothetical protein